MAIGSRKIKQKSINLDDILSNDAKHAFDDWVNKRYTR